MLLLIRSPELGLAVEGAEMFTRLVFREMAETTVGAVRFEGCADGGGGIGMGGGGKAEGALRLEVGCGGTVAAADDGRRDDGRDELVPLRLIVPDSE